MHEQAEDLAELQRVIDDSYRNAGSHLLDVSSPERRLDATQLTEKLDGMRLLALATTTRDGRPMTGAVDGIFYRGRFHFGSAYTSVRYRHLSERPAVSATHLPGEHFGVTVHGDAEFIDVTAPEHREFKQTLLDIYLPRFGQEWADMVDDGGAWYARLNPRRVFTFWMPELEGT